jgi:hypothetical protein
MISSNPYHPLRLQRELLTHRWESHGWLMERCRWWWWWRSLPNPRPGRVPEQSFWFRITVSDGGGTAEVYLGSRTCTPFRSEGICRRKEGSRQWPRRSHNRWARPGLGRAPWLCGGLPTPLRLVSGFVGPPVKYDFCNIYPDFYCKLDFCTKMRH